MAIWIVTYTDDVSGRRYDELCASSAEAGQFVWRLNSCGTQKNPMISRYSHIETREELNPTEQAKVDAIRAETAAIIAANVAAQQEEAKASWGGKREGAGRKPETTWADLIALVVKLKKSRPLVTRAMMLSMVDTYFPE